MATGRDSGTDITPPPRTAWRETLEFVRTRFLAGIDFLAPFLITWVVLHFLFGLGRDIFAPAFIDFFGKDIPGLGFAILIGTPLVIGAVGLHFVGARALIAIETGASRLPIIGAIFAVSHQIVSAMGGGEESGFRRVVAIEYPRRGIWSLGFLTKVTTIETGQKLAVIYIPTTPTPNSGNLLMVPVEEVMITNLRVNELMRTVLSAGVSCPDEIIRQATRVSDIGEAVPLLD
jgi:uncharacterized membrane protein